MLIQGRLDLQGPPATACALSKAWTRSQLLVIANAGHKTSDAGMAEVIVAAAARFAKPA